MGAMTYEYEITSPIPPKRLFKSYILDEKNLFPKALPQTVKAFEILEGDGGVATVKSIHFCEGSHFKSAKHSVDEIDKENLVFKYIMIDGDPLTGVHDTSSNVVKIEPGPDGGSVCKTTIATTPKRMTTI
ncbi:hypothetical protein CDL12_19018 [Handroanthus impetiginosus]|uniref:Bet v I/Major latex protein domain-containing protein n=1 Tax=Handroanthus impetiginosus TaxID=429701 RepID=A0A2G9GSX6_9LAMI|nr:hypothetical protein CDL12_19018 [Handroanthus impetiginosus]